MKHHPAVHHFHGSGEHHWFTDHAKSVSFILSCPATGVLLWALAAIRNYIEPTI